MFSITTIVSSTTRPIAMAMPPSVIVFSDISMNPINSKLNKIDNGIETTTIKVILILRRNKRIIIAASKPPSAPSLIIP
ncbi:hypothetical protein D3C76_1365200 [compost metagenome]